MDKDKIIGNATTIIKCASMIVAGATIGLCTSYGLQLPWNETQIAEAITAIVFAILAYYDARYPNTFINKSNEPTITINVETTEETTDEEDAGDDQQ